MDMQWNSFNSKSEYLKNLGNLNKAHGPITFCIRTMTKCFL